MLVNLDVYLLFNVSDVQLVIFNFVTEDGELRRTLQSLACGKARVLTKNPKVGGYDRCLDILQSTDQKSQSMWI